MTAKVIEVELRRGVEAALWGNCLVARWQDAEGTTYCQELLQTKSKTVYAGGEEKRVWPWRESLFVVMG